MAAAHGFRVFVVSAYRNRIKGRDPEDVTAGSQTADEIINLLEQLHARGTVFLDPPPVADDDVPQKRATTATIGPPIIVNEHLVHLELFHGEVGERPFARHRSEEAKELDDWSAEVGHFMTLVFPKASDTRFFVVSQSIHRRDPISLLIRLLRIQSFDNKQNAIAEEQAEREAAKDRGETPKKRQTHTKLLFERTQATDNDYLDGIVGRAKRATVEFSVRVPSSRGADTDAVRRKLQISLLDERERQISSVLGRRWLGRRRRGEETSHSEGVSELAAQLEEHDLMDAAEADGYTSASISLAGDNGGTTRIAVDSLRDVFTYAVSDGPPSAYQHYKAVAPRLMIIAREEGVELEEIVPLEVDQWLTD